MLSCYAVSLYILIKMIEQNNYFYTFINIAHDDHKKFPLPTPENDWKGFTREWKDDGYALGDYPNLPDISYQRRQHKGWWDPQERRNFGEPVSVQRID